MAEAATYSAVETLRGGRQIEIRALRPEDRSELLTAVGRTSPESLYRRFFSVKRGFTEQETIYFLNIDFVDHVALVAVVEEASLPVIVGGARYIVLQPGKAEIAFTVIDPYQGQGIGAALMRHLAGIARRAGLRELVAEVLPRMTRCSRCSPGAGSPSQRRVSSTSSRLRFSSTQLNLLDRPRPRRTPAISSLSLLLCTRMTPDGPYERPVLHILWGWQNWLQRLWGGNVASGAGEQRR
jgi:GNAT superfamily N-acetyltransferase